MNTWNLPIYMTLINNVTNNWEKDTDYKSSQGKDSVMGNQLSVKEEEDTTAPPKPGPLTDQPLVQ